MMTAQTTAGSLREHQREATRDWIRKAARTCFQREGAGNVSMDMVAAEAGTSRPTLYLYFPSKGALLLDLLEQSLKATDRIYERLRDLPEVSLAHVRAWLAGYLDEVTQHADAVDLFRDDLVPGDQLREIIRGHIDRTIRLLAPRYARFDLAVVAGAERDRRRAEAELIIREIEHFCREASRSDYHLNREVTLDVVAEHLTAMLSPIPM